MPRHTQKITLSHGRPRKSITKGTPTITPAMTPAKMGEKLTRRGASDRPKRS